MKSDRLLEKPTTRRKPTKRRAEPEPTQNETRDMRNTPQKDTTAFSHRAVLLGITSAIGASNGSQLATLGAK